jgi:ABC-2 type transport system permease protein
MLIKEFLQLLRDPRMRAMVFGAPLLMLLIFAFALTTDVTNIRMAVLDLDNTESSREFLHRVTASGYFQIVEYAESQRDISRLLDHGIARVVLHIPPGYEEDLSSGRTAMVQLIADGTDSNTAAIVFSYMNQIMGRYAQEKSGERIGATAGTAVPGLVQVETRAWYNPNMESKYFYVPGLVGLMLILFSMILTSIAIVREKEIGTIEQVMVTPITRLEFVLGKTIPYIMIGYVTMTVMLAAAMLIFGVRVQGSWLLLYALTGVYLVGNVGLSLFISASAMTQQQALLTAFFIMVPAILLSGFLIPVHNMPEAVQYLTWLNPMRWYMEILRGVVIKGVGFSSIWQAATGQTVLAVLFTAMASVRFRKTMA